MWWGPLARLYCTVPLTDARAGAADRAQRGRLGCGAPTGAWRKCSCRAERPHPPHQLGPAGQGVWRGAAPTRPADATAAPAHQRRHPTLGCGATAPPTRVLIWPSGRGGASGGGLPTRRPATLSANPTRPRPVPAPTPVRACCRPDGTLCLAAGRRGSAAARPHTGAGGWEGERGPARHSHGGGSGGSRPVCWLAAPFGSGTTATPVAIHHWRGRRRRPTTTMRGRLARRRADRRGRGVAPSPAWCLGGWRFRCRPHHRLGSRGVGVRAVACGLARRGRKKEKTQTIKGLTLRKITGGRRRAAIGAGSHDRSSAERRPAVSELPSLMRPSRGRAPRLLTVERREGPCGLAGPLTRDCCHLYAR